MTVMYRYENFASASFDEIDNVFYNRKVKLFCYEFPIIRNTPCGVVIDYWGTEKFINTTKIKQFANATKEAALEAFKKRKLKSISIMKARIKDAEWALQLVEKENEI